MVVCAFLKMAILVAVVVVTQLMLSLTSPDNLRREDPQLKEATQDIFVSMKLGAGPETCWIITLK